MESKTRTRALSQAAHVGAVIGDSGRAMEPANQAPAPKPAGMPDAAADWRENFERLAPVTAASPLPTRQLRRMAARALARTLSTVQKFEDRKQSRINKKRARALAAAETRKHDAGTTE